MLQVFESNADLHGRPLSLRSFSSSIPRGYERKHRRTVFPGCHLSAVFGRSRHRPSLWTERHYGHHIRS